MVKSRAASEKNENEISLKELFSNGSAFFQKNKHYFIYLVPVLLIVIAMSFTYSNRMQTASLSGMDDQAESAIYSQIEQMLFQQYQQRQPFAPEATIQRNVARDMQEIRKTGVYQGADIRASARQQAQFWKESFQKENQTYLLEIDPLFYLKNAELFRENGFYGTELRNGTPHDVTRVSPTGVGGSYKVDFHTWLIANLLSWKNIPVDADIADKTKAIFFLPALFAALCVIPAYFLTRKFTSDIYAFFAALVIVSISTFVYRTVAGFVDTDSYNILFPLAISAALVYGLMTKRLWVAITFGVLAGFFQGFFLWAWNPGWFIFIFLIGAIVAHVGYVFLASFLETKSFTFYKKFLNEFTALFLFMISSAIFSNLLAGQNILLTAFTAARSSLNLLAGTDTGNIWPNVLSSVAELNPASLGQIISSISPTTGTYIMLIAMFGVLALALDYQQKHKFVKVTITLLGLLIFSAIIFNNAFITLTTSAPIVFLVLLFLPVIAALLYGLICKNTNASVFLSLLLSIWIAGTMYMSFNGVRFILLMAPAIGVGFAVGLYYIAKALLPLAEQLSQSYKQQITAAVAIILFIILYFPMATQAQAIAKQSTPSFDDAWYAAMDAVQANSTESAIITSWWDFGHFFRAIGNRGVTFDGASQNLPQSHWVGKLLLENDDEISQDILHMLSCGGNEAFELMQNYSKDATGGVLVNKIIYQTLGTSKDETEAILKSNENFNFTEAQTVEIMNKLKCDAPYENIFVTSGDMVGKAPVWAHWGSWDFSKKYVLDNYQKMSSQQIASAIDEDVALVQQYVNEINQIDSRARAGVGRRNDLINQWLAPYPGYIPVANGYINSCTQKGDLVSCDNSIVLNTTSGIATSQLNAQIRRVLMPQDEGLVFTEQDETGAIDVVFLPTENGLQVLLAQYPLGGSLFTKLFYMNGFNTSYFDQIHDSQSVTAGRIIIWKTKWD